MQYFRNYLLFLQWKSQLPTVSFWSHVLRYGLFYSVVWIIAIIWGYLYLTGFVSVPTLQTQYTRISEGIQQLYQTGLVVSYDPKLGIATNATGPVIVSLQQVMQAFSFEEDTSTVAMKKNLLVLDTSWTVEQFSSYDSIILLTATHLVAQGNNEMKVVPVTTSDSTQSTIMITQDTIQALITEGRTRIDLHGKEFLQKIFLWWWVIALVLLPLFAFLWAVHLLWGLAVMAFFARLLSKLWVTISYQQLFRGLAWLYLPFFMLFSVLSWIGFGLPFYVSWLVMLALLGVLIEHEDNNSIPTS